MTKHYAQKPQLRERLREDNGAGEGDDPLHKVGYMERADLTAFAPARSALEYALEENMTAAREALDDDDFGNFVSHAESAALAGLKLAELVAGLGEVESERRAATPSGGLPADLIFAVDDILAELFDTLDEIVRTTTSPVDFEEMGGGHVRHLPTGRIICRFDAYEVQARLGLLTEAKAKDWRAMRRDRGLPLDEVGDPTAPSALPSWWGS